MAQKERVKKKKMESIDSSTTVGYLYHSHFRDRILQTQLWSFMFHPLFLHSFIIFSSIKNDTVPGNIAKPAKPEMHDTAPVPKDPTVYAVGKTHL